MANFDFTKWCSRLKKPLNRISYTDCNLIFTCVCCPYATEQKDTSVLSCMHGKPEVWEYDKEYHVCDVTICLLTGKECIEHSFEHPQACKLKNQEILPE